MAPIALDVAVSPLFIAGLPLQVSLLLLAVVLASDLALLQALRPAALLRDQLRL
eukprot:CAMPEP_0198461288 /NCGR_PEP_ID=MMETSP1456-20131121/77_1 /TAXON_ID=1461544 ORGANISM="Unidentified sp., Strain RCC1871" /NCGR_SAMPLE_ID=MMETSP1456 /ASSEMBLY_ACC=CAM_ASM_001119 /LENGTH=53 /DNA_ID=CAMNT_0044186305 /DNA_START=16 /DNA_END=174 /DNA_ORIENTATION=+